MALDNEGPHLSRVGGPSGNLTLKALIGVVVALVVIALVKPWAFGPAARPRPFAPPTVVPTPTVKASDPADYFAPAGRMYPQCYSSSAWRVAALSREPDYEVRTVWPVPFAQSTSLEDAVAAARLVAGADVLGIGFCVPGSDSQTRSAFITRVSLWRLDEVGQLVIVRDTVAIDQTLADLGEVYLAPPHALSADGSWPSGTYVFKVDLGGGNATWFALHIVDASPSPSSQPSPSPSPSPSFPSPEPAPSPGNGVGTALSGRLLAR